MDSSLLIRSERLARAMPALARVRGFVPAVQHLVTQTNVRPDEVQSLLFLSRLSHELLLSMFGFRMSLLMLVLSEQTLQGSHN